MRVSAIKTGVTKKLSVGIVGPGLIGKTLLKQIEQQHGYLKDRVGVEVSLEGIASSRKMLLSPTGVDLAAWPGQFEEKATAADLDTFTKHFEGLESDAVVIDCTASDAPCDYYARWMAAGVHVITPNKKLHSGPISRYQEVRNQQAAGAAHYFYETSCGAGLPVLAPLKALIESGDEVISVEGILSGTLSYIFNTWQAGTPFSEVVLAAKDLGYTEPDPREDLSGMDVARKVTILARECGSPASLEDLDVSSLVPAELEGLSVDEYLKRLPDFDDDMAAKLADAQASGDVLRYVGKYDAGSDTASITLARYPEAHPFAQLNGTDNIIQIRTKRYDDQPLIIRGPGAGPDVTAAGIFSDLLTLMRYLGARS